MKRKFLSILSTIFFLIIFCFTANAQNKKGWKLIWQDEFNYTGLPDATKWGYEVGHIRNNEQQYYTRAKKENVWVSNGVLIITGRKENYKNENYKNESTDWRYKDSIAQYTSASINTLGKAAWKYGRIEVKAKLPTGNGIWPAIWMMGANRSIVGWPICGEIDIMEFIGNHPADIYSTIHFPDSIKTSRSSGSKINDSTVSNRFHIYTLEWDKQKMDIWFDKIKIHSFVIDSAGSYAANTFRKPFYLLINLAMGANWPGPIDDNVLPQQYLIDYVRVYQKK